MPYIGKQPVIGEFVELDALTASATADYTLTRNGAAYYPETVNNLLVSINGVIQAGSTMSLLGNTLTVGATLSSSDVIDFVRVFGNVGNVVTPTDGSVTSAKLDTNIEISGILTEPNKEYFQVDLTTTQSGITDATFAIVDFNTNGTVKYDTKSNFDASTNSYELDSADGVYWVEYSLAITSDTAGSPELITSTSAAEFSTDNFSSINSRISEFTRSLNAADAYEVSHHHKRSTIFKATSSGTKIRLQATCNPAGNQASTYRFAHNISTQSSFADLDGTVTSLIVMRIA